MDKEAPSNYAYIAQQYLQHYRSRQSTDVLFSVWETVEKLVQENPQQAWCVIQHIINYAENDAEIAYVAAGPLEDLLQKHFLEIKADLMVAMRTHTKIRKAVESVWLAPDSPARQWLDGK